MTGSDFAGEVDEVLGPLLRSLGFSLDETDDQPDEGGRPRHIAYYQSKDCKLQIYHSSREGEINCMIAPLVATNEFGLNAENWHFITSFSKRADLPLDELLRRTVAEARSYDNQLDFVKARLSEHYKTAHEAILAKYPTA